jgi:primosomal protein N' (replication factor Y)
VQDRKVLSQTLEAFRSHEIDIMVGTQMLAKGHDFPKVSLVAMIEVDQLLGMPDFRGGERTFQLIVQASGRAGRADHAGKVLIQTHRTSHPVIQNAIQNDYQGFVRKELEFRKAQGFPPMGKMVLVEINSANARDLERFSDKVGEFVDDFMQKHGAKLGDLKILGPAPAPIEIVRGRVRKQLMIFCSQPDILNKSVLYLQKFMESATHTIRVKYDIDPQSTF